jgi:class 3 adenylate cyclase
VTFLFTDIEGSTTLWDRYPAAMQAALARHDSTLRHSIESCNGHVVKTTGDGVFAVFGAPADALAASIAAQRALNAPGAEGSVPEPTASDTRLPVKLKIRMGLHTGEAEFRDGDYFGTTLNRAARIMRRGSSLNDSSGASGVRRRWAPRSSIPPKGSISLTPGTASAMAFTVKSRRERSLTTSFENTTSGFRESGT